jgi:lipopolysaccharide heptosyltransferase II
VTILEVMPTLSFGGVESYVVGLARGLRARGHRVLVASEGGPLLEQLREHGIEHLPFKVRGRFALPAARELSRLIADQGVDLVNAHNWRSAAISWLAARARGVPYVFTVHGIRPAISRRLVFYWSRRLLVVSEESRANLVRDFRLPSERVAVVPIGVDPLRFAPAGPEGALLRELGLEADSRRVIHLSRFSRSKSAVARALIEAAALLEGVEIILVGEGPEQTAVRQEAEAMNARLGRRALVFLQARLDVTRLLNLGEAAVATATAALEAMACAKPVIAAGKAGYLGPIGRDNLARAEETCFGDHGSLPPILPEQLARDLRFLLDDPARRADLGQLGREAVLRAHTLEAAAEAAEAIYREEALPRAGVRRILLLHLNQIGDLLFSLPALKALREAFPGAHIASLIKPHLEGLLCACPFIDEVIFRPAGMLPALRQAVRLRARGFDLAFAFSQSATSCLSARLSGAKLRIGFADAALPRCLNRRVQGRGISSPRKVARLLRALGLAGEERNYVGLVHLGEEDRRQGEALLREAVGEARPIIALAPGESARRPYKSWPAERFAALARWLREQQTAVVVVGSEADRSLGDLILDGLRGPAANLAGRTSVGQLAAVLSRCEGLVGIDSGPLHAAAAMGRPVVGLYGPTDPAETGPRGERHRVLLHPEPCFPCITPSCEGRRPCLMKITVEEVIGAVEEMLEP